MERAELAGNAVPKFGGVCEKGVDGVLCGAQTHKCPKEGSNRSVQNLRFQGRGLLTSDTIPHFEKNYEGRAGGVSLVFVVVVKTWARVCGKGGNDVVGDAQN